MQAKNSLVRQQEAVKFSPCIKKCKLVGAVCEGCGRTIDEIIEAGKAYNEQRRKESSGHANKEKKNLC